MSLTCPTSPIYATSVEQKRHSREAVKRRCATPKVLRDLLRAKCRIRFKEARHSAYESTRKLVELISVEQILRRELAELEKDVDLQAEIYEELKTDANNWFAEQLEDEQNYLIEVGDSQELICPICQKSVLEFVQPTNLYECLCGTSFLYPGNCAELRAALELRVTDHGQRCDENLLFFIEPFQYGSKDGACILSTMCDNCDYFASF